MSQFINRRSELAFFDRSWSARSPQLVVLYGRRRVGKTALLRQFAEGRPAFHYMATRLPEAQQLRELGQALGTIVDDPALALCKGPQQPTDDIGMNMRRRALER